MYKCEYFKYVCDMTNFLNENHIRKENIVKIIIDRNDRYTLIYYKERA